MKNALASLVFIIAGILAAGFYGAQSAVVSCERLATGGPVDCVIRRCFFGVVFSSLQVHDVSGASWQVGIDDEGEENGYVISLGTPNGLVPLTYSPVTSLKDETVALVAQVNSLVQADAPGTLVVTHEPAAIMPVLACVAAIGGFVMGIIAFSFGAGAKHRQKSASEEPIGAPPFD